MFIIQGLSRILLLSERSDIINYFKVACGSKIALSVGTEFTEIPSISFELLIFDTSLIIKKTNALYRCLEFFSDRLVCLLPIDTPYGIRKYVESRFKFIIPFPVTVETFRENLLSMQNQLQQRLKTADLSLLENENIPDTVLGYFCGSSSIIKSVRKKILSVADTNEPVLLLGETGTGKTTAGALIHGLSERGEKKMVSYSLSTVVESLAESTFFGHVKGSYTNALIETIGLFEAANGSTVFFDELGLASLAVQAMLLTVLETGNFKKVGSQKEQHVDVRVIFATNADLTQMLREGTFRTDLYWRICDNIIKLPSLRERKEDICDMVESYISKEDYTIKDEAIEKLENYSWPGNIRQLHKCLRRAMSRAKDHVIRADQIDFGDINSLQ